MSSEDRPRRPRSLREFDYFAQEVEPPDPRPGADHAPISLEEHAAERVRWRRRLARDAILAALFLCVSGWFLWGERYRIAYAFSWAQPPLELGDVSRFRPEDIPHNAYVSLRGITEHRGLQRKSVQGLSLYRQERWYFRLSGSRGVFIMVEPDSARYGMATEVSVAGRAVDPAREARHDDVLNTYRQRFVSRERPTLRVIEVGVAPGDGRLAYGLAIALVIALAVANGWALWRMRAKWHKP